MSRHTRPGWKRVKHTLWTWGAYSVRRQCIEGSMCITHKARLNGVELAGREGLAEAQRYCEQHAEQQQARAPA